MSRRVTRLYPFFFAVVPILKYAATNPDLFRFDALALLLGSAVAFCGVIYALARLAGGRGLPAALPAFVAFLGVAWMYGYNRLRVVVSPDAAHAPHAILILVAVALTAACIWWIRRREALLEGMGRFLTLTAALLIGWSTVQIGTWWVSGRSAIAGSALARDLARPIDGPATVPEPRRDVYLIVLDEYANSAVLRERTGYDNSAFEDSLRALGFHVPALVRSNYAHTLLSLPSMLNAAHLTALEGELGAETRQPALPNYLLEHNRGAAYLQARGYRYVFFPSSWWHSTSSSATANAEFHPWSGFDFRRFMSSGELPRTIRGATLLRYVDSEHRWEAEHTRLTLGGLADLARDPVPTFAFAHVLKPHDPYVFDRECRTLPRVHEEEQEMALYLEQLECVNRMLLQTVGDILRTSTVPPIIILQGDHGSKFLGATGYDRAEDVPAAAARERLGAFGAYYLPAGGAAAFGDTVTVVNVLGNVLRHYFGAHLPRAGDEQYISPAHFPYAFRKVDARWLAEQVSAGPVLRAGR
jgi:hypothetical protein